MYKTKTKWLAGALALTLLSGCTGKPADDDLAYLTTGIQRDSALLTVNGRAVPAEKYLFWLSNAVETMRYYGLTDESDWNAPASDGVSTIAEGLKADALQTTLLYEVITQKAAELGVTLSQEEESRIQTDMAENTAALGGEEAFQEMLAQQCISNEGFQALNRVYYLNEALRAKLAADGLLDVTEADVDTYIQENGIYAAKHILIATRRAGEGYSYEEYTEEEKAQAAEKARDLRRQLAEADDSEELFDTLMNQYSEDGRDENGDLYYPQGYTYVFSAEKVTGYGQTAMVPEFEEGALALELGQISDPIQTDYGYHIILRIPVDREQVKADCTADYKLQQLTQQWMDEAVVETTQAYDELDVKLFYQNLTAQTEARAAAAAAESAAPVESTAPAESGAPEESSVPTEGQ